LNNKDNKFYSGFVSIIGRPNVGKSTLMNCLIGEKIAITSRKAQTTRNKITTILTRDNFQIIFLDTPGIFKPKSKLDRYMEKSVKSSIANVDIILYLVEPREKISPMDLEIIEKLQSLSSKVFLIINKVDLIEKDYLLQVIDNYSKLYEFDEVIPVSAIKGENVLSLTDLMVKNLPEGPKFFPDDMITDQPEKQIVAEIIREKILILTHEEIPHGVAVEIMSMKQRKDKEIMDIEATIYCERESHKGMLIGKKGAKLKDIGTRARLDMERFLDFPVNLKLWVKVKKDWRDNEFYLKNFGYDKKNV